MFVCLGDVGVDLLKPSGRERAGGCASYVAVAAAKVLGPDAVTVVSAVGDDARSETALAFLRAHELATELIVRLPGATPQQTIAIDAQGERRFLGYDPGVYPQWRPNAAQAGALAAAACISTVVFAQKLALFEAVLSLPRGGELFADFMDAADFGHDFRRIIPWIERVEGAFFGLDSRRNGVLIERIRSFAAETGKLCVVTLGDEGALVFDGIVEQRFVVELPLQVIDTTGAGDTFAGTYLALRTCGKAPRDCLDAAAAAATHHVTAARD